MTVQINGWVVLLIVAMLLMGYAVGYVTVKVMMPPAVAQIAGNQALVTQLNAVLEAEKKATDARLVKIEARLDAIERAE